MLKLFNRPLYIFFFYVVIIFLFAFMYWVSPSSSFGKDLTPSQSLYLSVITITTLGYGDITPVDKLGMFLTALESISGILIMGLFVNFVGKNYSDRMEKEQLKKVRESLKELNKKNLLSYFSYLSFIFQEYSSINYELTTPLSERKGEKYVFKPGFKFSDLKNIFGPSLGVKFVMNPSSIISIYFEEEKLLVGELKYILANFGLEDFPKLKTMIIEFLKISYVTNFEEALLGYRESLKKRLEEEISKLDEIPTDEGMYENVLAPVKILFKTIPMKMALINEIEKEFGVLKNET